MLSPALPENVTTDISLPDGPCLVRANAAQMHQVALNLVKNAVDAMAETGGVLTVSLSGGIASDPGDAVCQPMFDRVLEPGAEQCICAKLVVADTGCGMDETVRARAFDPFFSTKPSGEGTGMGLAVVHGIVQSYGGWIGLDTAAGRGATFTICLPQVKE